MPTGSGGGLASVQTNVSLSGAGTAASPLSVANWPLIYFSAGATGNAETLAGANTIDGFGFVLPYALTFSNITINVATADAVNNADIGIYTQAGLLVAHVGPQLLATTGNHTLAIVGGAQTIKPGLYAFAWCSAAATLQLATASTGLPPWFQSNNIGVSVSATLPASISAITISPKTFSLYMALS